MNFAKNWTMSTFVVEKGVVVFRSSSCSCSVVVVVVVVLVDVVVLVVVVLDEVVLVLDNVLLTKSSWSQTSPYSPAKHPWLHAELQASA